MWYDHMSLLGDEGIPVEWLMEDTHTQGKAQESCGSVYSLQLDLLPVGVLRLIQTICLCLRPGCLGEISMSLLAVNLYCGSHVDVDINVDMHALCDFSLSLSLQWMVQELNTFYLKAMLWVPPNHSLNLHREIIYALSGACAVKELYDYLSST